MHPLNVDELTIEQKIGQRLIARKPRSDADKASIIEMVGPDRVMFSADFPHGDFDTPEELFRPIVSHFDDETIRGIMGETAIEVFEIPQ